MTNTYACKGVSDPNVSIFPPRVCTLVLFIFLSNCAPLACAIFEVILLYIIIFSKLRDGTSGNLLYVSGYQAQFYGISMKIRQCACFCTIFAMVPKIVHDLRYAKYLPALLLSLHHFFLHIQYVCLALYSVSCVQKVNMLWEL